MSLAAHHGRLVAAVPETIAGKLEIRSRGSSNALPPAVVRLVVDLMPAAECPRLPEDDEMTAIVDGVAIRRLMLPVGITDGAERVRAALAAPWRPEAA